MQFPTLLVIAIFLSVYVGMALGRWPGLKVDRTGIALVGALVLCSTGLVTNAMVLQAIDFPTLIVLFGVMVFSAQFAVCGFYTGAPLELRRRTPHQLQFWPSRCWSPEPSQRCLRTTSSSLR